MCRWDLSLSLILRIFLIFSDFEPSYSCKRYSYDKNAVCVSYSCKRYSYDKNAVCVSYSFKRYSYDKNAVCVSYSCKRYSYDKNAVCVSYSCKRYSYDKNAVCVYLICCYILVFSCYILGNFWVAMALTYFLWHLWRRCDISVKFHFTDSAPCRPWGPQARVFHDMTCKCFSVFRCV